MEKPTHFPSDENFDAEETFSIANQLLILWKSIIHAFSNWRIIFVSGVLGAGLGICYFVLKPIHYKASITFVVEDSKSSGGGSIISALAGQFGMDVGGLSGTSGVLAGDNVLQLLKSKSLIKKTLLTPFVLEKADASKSNGAQSLADEYVKVYGLDKKWINSNKVGRQVYFHPSNTKLPRLEDSLLQKIIKNIIEKELTVTKPDKKLGFFEMSTNMRSETLSNLFCTRLLTTATNFYIETKTKRLSTNVERLQYKADSLLAALNRKTYSSVDANRLLLDANPAYATPVVNAEMTVRDKMIQGTIYADIVKNLEISRTSLIQETPTVQIVDQPELPLPNDKQEWWLLALMGASLLIFIAVVLTIATRKYLVE